MEMPNPESIACPHCSAELEAAAIDVPQVIVCPACQQSFVLPGIDGSTELPIDQDDQREREEAEQRLVQRQTEELSGLRIRNLSVGKRAAIRARSYFLVAALGCLVAFGQCLSNVVNHVIIRQLTLWDVTYVLIGIASIWGVDFCLRRARALLREIEATSLSEPTAAPDFAPLNDGSQIVRNLEEIR